MASLDLEKVRTKLLVLVMINVHQPVDVPSLLKRLEQKINAEQIETILDELVQEDRVVEERGQYRLTRYGYKAIIPVRGRILRDVHRMKHLFEVTQQRGGGDSRTTLRRP
jgi:predicted transcriptional regulator